MAGVAQKIAELVIARDGQCTLRATHTFAKSGEQICHRLHRQMGGTNLAYINAPANLCWGCADCHDYCHANMTEGYANGWLLRHGQDPLTTRMLYMGYWVYLDNSGLVRSLTPFEVSNGF